MSLKIVTDSTFNLDQDFIEENDIHVVPLNVIVDNKNYLDGTISIDDVITALEEGKKVSTSQPSPSTFEKLFNDLKSEGYKDVLCLTLSSTLSGTYQSAMIAKNEVEGINIVVFDTLSAAMGAEIFAQIAVREKEKPIEEIVSKLEVIRNNSGLLFNMQNLNVLKSSGRISKIKATIGNLLRVKPIIEYFDGKVNINSKFRTDSQVFKWITQKMKAIFEKVNTKVHIIVAHIKAEERVEKLLNFLKESFPKIPIKLKSSISPVIAINVGYGGIGVAWSYE